MNPNDIDPRVYALGAAAIVVNIWKNNILKAEYIDPVEPSHLCGKKVILNCDGSQKVGDFLRIKFQPKIDRLGQKIYVPKIDGL